MKKNYISPEVEVVKFRLTDAILYSKVESDMPVESDEPVLPGPGDELGDL